MILRCHAETEINIRILLALTFLFVAVFTLYDKATSV